ncbi:hypothetical protein BSKO_02992 [Bryopsis sp. KO-2023]|nr:hypothetical protein BSKO_02992 [Bryopsis sp. KO-2023]
MQTTAGILQSPARAIGHTRRAPIFSKAGRRCSVQASANRDDIIPSSTRREMGLSMVAISGAAAALEFASPPTSMAGECKFQAAPNGLEYCDTEEGAGPEPVQGSMIRAHYTGRLESNGKVFDSSYERGRPLQFKIGVRQVIQGWDMGILGTEGIPPMKEGGKRKLRIPADLAYGERGAGGGLIPPGATLIFDVEYLGKAGRR